MNIEISPKEYWKELKYDDAVLYCQLLEIDDKNDWRLPKSCERAYLRRKLDLGIIGILIPINGGSPDGVWVIPVRDI